MDLKQWIKDQTDVAWKLTKHVISKEAKDSNFVFSPTSINLVLSLIAAGSNGQTLEQLLKFLKAESNDRLGALSAELVSVVFADGSKVGGPKLSVANSVWIDRTLSFKPGFKQVADSIYKATTGEVDFQRKGKQVVYKVNLWAVKNTDGLIKEVIPEDSVDNSSRLLFANALYFKGHWAEKFESSDTQDHDFHLRNGRSVRVPFMTTKNKQFLKAYDGFKVLRLPYKQGDDKRLFSFNILLPDAKDGLSALTEKIASESSGFVDQHIPDEQVEVGEFRVPKFKIGFGFEASKVLKDLGLVLPFSGGEGGLTEIVEDSPEAKNLNVSDIFQKSFIEINEEGTEAAAASAAVLTRTSLPEKTDFVANHPFLFFVREEVGGVVLFIGHILDPSKKDD